MNIEVRNHEIGNHQSEIIFYKTDDGKTDIKVRFESEDVWLSQQQMAELYQTSRTNIVEHIKHIFQEEELIEEATCRKFGQVQTEGRRNVEREIPFYNLDTIVAGETGNSRSGTDIETVVFSI